ncbi:MAG TPA: hypothetical protein VHW74_13150 [Mycobacteriales bacterium]|nr:hypothetical protein [Mycobacteriales bacterium]
MRRHDHGVRQGSRRDAAGPGQLPQLHHVVTGSTSSFTGMPHADTVVYANDDRRIFFHVAPDTQMHRNITDS